MKRNSITYKCAEPKCGMSLLDLKPASLVDECPKVGDLLICGGCASVNVVKLTGTELITNEELSSLSKEERSDLLFAQRAIRRNFRN